MFTQVTGVKWKFQIGSSLSTILHPFCYPSAPKERKEVKRRIPEVCRPVSQAYTAANKETLSLTFTPAHLIIGSLSIYIPNK